MQLTTRILLLLIICFSIGACSNSEPKTPEKAEISLKKETEQAKTATTEQKEDKEPWPTGEENPQRFEDVIQGFEAKDQTESIEKGGILFTGSSSIRMWKTLKEDMAPYPVINRGFGGSTIPEVLTYFERLVIPYAPKLIVLYCGENDISEGATPEYVLQTFTAFVQAVEFKFPEAKIAYISMKPSIARWDLWPQYQKGNQLIADLIKTKPNIKYLDSSQTMLNADGQPKPEIFIEDKLHMNAEGYIGWTNFVKPVLEEWYELKE